MQDTRTDNTLVDIITCMRKHILGMLIVFVCIVLVATTIILMQTPIYEVASRVLVKYGREYVYTSVDQAKEGYVNPFYTYTPLVVINTEIEILNSGELAEEVITSIGVEKLFPNLVLNEQDIASTLPFAVNRFAAMLKVFYVKDSNVIGISFQHQDPNVAVQAVSQLIERYKERHLEIFKNPQTSFLKELVDLNREQLEEAENALKIFRQENNIYFLDLEEQQKTFMFQYDKLNAFLITENSELVGLAEKKAALESQLEKIPEITQLFEGTIRGSDTETVGYKLLDLQLLESNLLRKYRDDNREVEAVREKIKLTENFMANQEVLWQDNNRNGPNPLFSQVKREVIMTTANYIAQEKKNNTLQRQLNQMKDHLQKMIPFETDLNRLKKQVEAAEETYKTFFNKFEDSLIQDAMDSQKMVNVVVVEKPRVPLRPIKPRKQLSLLVGIILGAACSFFYALFVEYVMVRKI